MPDRGIDQFPVFKVIATTANPVLAAAQETVVTVTADPEDCPFQFNPTGTARFTASCAIAKAMLARALVNYSSADAAPGTAATVQIGDTLVSSHDCKLTAAAVKDATAALETARTGTDQAATDAAQLALDGAKAAKAAFEKAVNAALTTAAYPLVAKDTPSVVTVETIVDNCRAQPFKLVLALTQLILLATMVYGPIAAALVELVPTRIRHSGMSLPYHIGNGWFGGLLPATGPCRGQRFMSASPYRPCGPDHAADFAQRVLVVQVEPAASRGPVFGRTTHPEAPDGQVVLDGEIMWCGGRQVRWPAGKTWCPEEDSNLHVF